MAEIKPLKVDTTNELARRWVTGDYLGLLHGGLGGDFSATGPGAWYQSTLGGAVTVGVLPIALFATGTPDGTKFVKDDGTLATPSTGGGNIDGGFPDTIYGSSVGIDGGSP